MFVLFTTLAVTRGQSQVAEIPLDPTPSPSSTTTTATTYASGCVVNSVRVFLQKLAISCPMQMKCFLNNFFIFSTKKSGRLFFLNYFYYHSVLKYICLLIYILKNAFLIINPHDNCLSQTPVVNLYHIKKSICDLGISNFLTLYQHIYITLLYKINIFSIQKYI